MKITKREKEILNLLYLTNPQIAKKLFIDLSTVKTHIHRLLVKFKAKTRTELYKKYMEVNIMYKLKVKDSIFTIPKQNIRLLAMTKAMDLHKIVKLDTEKDAIDFLKSISIEVIE